MELTEYQKKKFLQQVSYHDVDFFNLKGLKTLAKCVKVYDGDTGTFVFYVDNKPYKFRCRLASIDTAEIKSNNPEEVVHAQKAKNRLIELIDDTLVYLECLEHDKYGRILVKIYKNDDDYHNGNKSFNKILVDEGLAYQYKGGKRVNFCEWKKSENA